MNTTNRLWHVVAAVGLALLAAMLTTFYVSNYKRNVQHNEAKVTVLVASKDIPVDTTGAEILSRNFLTKVSVARRQVVPGAISRPEQLRNLIATQPVYAGEQVTRKRFGTPAERGIRAQITGKQRAIEIDGNANQLLAGTLRVGDHVDVVGAWGADDFRGNGALTTTGTSTVLGRGGDVTRVILRNLLVLQAPITPGKSGGLAPNGGLAVQLRLTDAESQRLEFIKAFGKDWRLVIRPPSDSSNSPRWYDNRETLLKDGVGIR
jgi:Flp pilus assembly protein CpaB